MYMRAYAELLLAYHIPLRFEAELAAAARHLILAPINIAIGIARFYVRMCLILIPEMIVVL